MKKSYEPETAQILKFEQPEVDDGTPDDLNWLKRQGVGTIFLCQRKNAGADFNVGAFTVVSITEEKSIYGLMDLQTNKPALVNPIRFCNVFELVEIVRNREEYLAEKRLNERDRADTVEGLANHERSEGVSQTDDESKSHNL